MTEPRKSSDWISALIALVAGVLLAVAGFALIHHNRNTMGFAMFVVLPTMIGFLVATLVRRLPVVAMAAVLVLAISMGFLLMNQWEGFVCCMMALPILIVCVTLGVVLAFTTEKILERQRRKNTMTKGLCIAVIPLFVLGADITERSTRPSARKEVVTTSGYLAKPPMEAWGLIKEVDRISVPKPFLLRIGLPVPLRCEMGNESVGGRRTCYFGNGLIEERITEWAPPKSMKMQIVSVTLPGRHWLHFEDASYELRPEGDGTVVTRTTTISSLLSPSWYWRPLERLGVTAEHDYLFAELNRRANLR